MPAPCYEVRGDGWTFSLQRLAVAPAKGMSANLGAAPIVELGVQGGVHRLAARAPPGERLWAAVTAPRGRGVEARLTDGRALVDAPMGDARESETAHFFARIEGLERDGFDSGDAGGVRVTIGDMEIDVEIVAAGPFDSRYGVAPDSAPDSVYGGWRLP